MSVPQEPSQPEITAWFAALRDRICASYEAIEQAAGSTARFVRQEWQRTDADGSPGGGGTMAVLRGAVFEKVGVNVSTVYGTFSPDFRAQIPGAAGDGKFWASGISLVAHPANPHVPAAHMNTRHIITEKRWFGGGADLNPMLRSSPFVPLDTARFHAALRAACDAFDPAWYDEYRAWCDRYFFIPHRNEARGVGGIFFDYHERRPLADDFAFVQAVGTAFAEVYPQIVRDRFVAPFTEAERTAQLIQRGRYAEFNLLYDRGTQFGLRTGGNPEAILMSLPPLVQWP